MSDQPDRDLLAAEYVLGTLEGEDDRMARRLLGEDPDFARSVAKWQRRLSPLARLAVHAPPPSDLWGRIEGTLGPATPAPVQPPSAVPLAPAPRWYQSVRLWQAGTAAGLAIAAGLAAFILARAPPPPRVAVLSPTAGGAPALVAVDQGHQLTIRPGPNLAAVPSNHDLELWALAAGAKRPRSLGVLPADGKQLATVLPPGTQLLVSLEPKGGSPTGLPTGPVLYGGRLTSMD